MRKIIIAALAMTMVLLLPALALAHSAPETLPGEYTRFDLRGKEAPDMFKKGPSKCPPEIQSLIEKFTKDNVALLQKIRENSEKQRLLKQRAANGGLTAEEQAAWERLQRIERDIMLQKRVIKDICLTLGENPKPKEVERAKQEIMLIQKVQLELLKSLLSELEKIS